MPIVPKPEAPSLGPQTVNAGFDARASSAGPDAVAQGVGNVGSVLQEDFLKHKQAADEIAVQEAEVKATHLTNTLLYDPTTGALNRRGKDAAGIPQDMYPKLDQGFSDITGSLTNDSQKRAFGARVAARREQVDGIVQSHISGEIRKWDDETTQGVIDGAQNDALTNYTSSQATYQSIMTQMDAIAAHARRNGVPPEMRDALIRDAESKTRTGVLGRMLDNDMTDEAKYYYGQWKERIDGQHQEIIDRALKVGIARDDSRKLADSVIMTTPKEGGAQDLQGALAELEGRKITDTKLYDDAKSRIVAHFDLQDRAENQRQADTYEQAVSALDNPNNTKGLDGVPPSILAGLTKPQYRRSFEAYAAARLKREAPTTDPNLYEDLYRRATTAETRQAFVDEPLSQYRDRLSPQAFEEVVKMQGRMREDVQKDAEKLDYTRGVESNERIVQDTLKSAGIVKPRAKDMTTDDNARVSAFRAQLNHALTAEQRVTGKIATPEQVRTAANKLLATTTWQEPGSIYNPFDKASWSWWFNPFRDDVVPNDVSKPAFEAPGADRVAYEINDVPSSEIADILGEFRRNGIAPPDPKDREGTRRFQSLVVDEYNKQVAKEARDHAKAGK